MDQYELQTLIDFGIISLSQTREFLDNGNFINETKEALSMNIILINSMIQTAIHFKGDEQQKNELITVLSKTLKDNYQFLQKLAQ